MNQELPDVQAGFRKGRGTRGQIANICWIIKKAREFQKNIYFCFMTMSKPLTVWITTNWKILKEMGIPDHLTCLLRNLYAGQEATVRIEHRTTEWFQIGSGLHPVENLQIWEKVPCTMKGHENLQSQEDFGSVQPLSRVRLFVSP